MAGLVNEPLMRGLDAIVHGNPHVILYQVYAIHTHTIAHKEESIKIGLII